VDFIVSLFHGESQGNNRRHLVKIRFPIQEHQRTH
jgi:hypothetical protein